MYKSHELNCRESKQESFMPHSFMVNIVPSLRFKRPPIVALNDQAYEENHIEVSMLRLDEIHPVISGNKLFKLLYFLDKAKNSTSKKVITFGGAFSNHLAATAFACSESGLECMGIVRGERAASLSPTLLFCEANGMKMEFVSREEYKKSSEQKFLDQLAKKHGEFTLIPEGGFSLEGAEGAAHIPELYADAGFTHICLPVGTATTFAGIIKGSDSNAQILGFPVLKNLNDIEKRLEELQAWKQKKYSCFGDYHFGGYAKKTAELISFMNRFYNSHEIPLDFVYTGKMMFGVHDLISKKYFPRGSKILCIHTGGLQGNNSLSEGILNY